MAKILIIISSLERWPILEESTDECERGHWSQLSAFQNSPLKAGVSTKIHLFKSFTKTFMSFPIDSPIDVPTPTRKIRKLNKPKPHTHTQVCVCLTLEMLKSFWGFTSAHASVTHTSRMSALALMVEKSQRKPDGAERSQLGRLSRVEADGTRVLSGQSQTWASVCACPDPPTSAAANHCAVSANSGPVFGRAHPKQPRLDRSCIQEQWEQSADHSLHHMTIMSSQDTKNRKLNHFFFCILANFGLKSALWHFCSRKYNNHQTLSEQFKLFLLIIFSLHLQQCFLCLFVMRDVYIYLSVEQRTSVCITTHLTHLL